LAVPKGALIWQYCAGCPATAIAHVDVVIWKR
jgi:hypothetical protein